jgi:uncharacterized caspase-like protein
VKSRIVFVILLLQILIISTFVVSIEVGCRFQHKAGVNLQGIEVTPEKSILKPSHGEISTGFVSNLPEGGEKWAVVIGISDYSGTLNDLNYCDDDAQGFYEALLSYGWKSSHIKLLIDKKATKKSILDAIVWMEGKEGPNDEVVFFYSGHGAASKHDMDYDREEKDECIVPWEADLDYLIWDSDLVQAFQNFESNRIMFYFDMCFSGGMTDLADPGRLLLMASKENQLSIESGELQNGQFTYYFVDIGMLEMKADVNNDALVTFEEAFDYAADQCQRQIPIAVDGFINDMPP